MDVKNGIENTISGSAIVMKVDPVVAARAGFTPQEIELDASAILQGEPATTPVIVNDRSYTIRVRFPETTRANARPDPQHPDHQQLHRQNRRLSDRWPNFTTKPGRPKFIRENLQRHVAVTGRFEGMSLGKGMEMVQKAVADMDVPPSIRVVYGGTYAGAAEIVSRSAAGARRWPWCWCSPCCCSNSANFAAPAAILASALLSTSGVFLALADHRTPPSTSRPSWD